MKKIKLLTILITMWAVSWSYSSGGFYDDSDYDAKKAEEKIQAELDAAEVAAKKATSTQATTTQTTVDSAPTLLPNPETSSAANVEIFSIEDSQSADTVPQKIECLAGIYEGALDVYWGAFSSITNSNSTKVQAAFNFTPSQTNSNDINMLMAVEWDEEDKPNHMLCSLFSQVKINANKLTGKESHSRGSIVDVGSVFPEFEFEGCVVTSFSVGGTREYFEDDPETIEGLTKTEQQAYSWEELEQKCKIGAGLEID